MLKNKMEGLDWVHLVDSREQRRAFVNRVTSISVPYNTGEFMGQVFNWCLLKNETAVWNCRDGEHTLTLWLEVRNY
jgi:hypothetical protein